MKKNDFTAYEKYGDPAWIWFMTGDLSFYEMMTVYYCEHELYYLDPVMATIYACEWLFELIATNDEYVCGWTYDEYLNNVRVFYKYLSEHMEDYDDCAYGDDFPPTDDEINLGVFDWDVDLLRNPHAPIYNVCHEFMVLNGIPGVFKE